MKISAEVHTLVRCLLGKTSEFEDLDMSGLVMAKVILDIHRKKTGKDVIRVPLFSLHQIHTRDRGNAIAATGRRMSAMGHEIDDTRRRRRAAARCLSWRYTVRVRTLTTLKTPERRPG